MIFLLSKQQNADEASTAMVPPALSLSKGLSKNLYGAFLYLVMKTATFNHFISPYPCKQKNPRIFAANE